MATARQTTLTRQHRNAQQRLRVATVSEMTRIWQATYDTTDIGRSFNAFSLQAVPLILDNRLISTELGYTYYSNYRSTAGLNGRFKPARASEPDPRRITKSLEYSARVGALKSIAGGKTPEEAARNAFVNTIGDGTRLVSEGGRETVSISARRDPQAIGWERVTGDNPCEFCSMIAARGPAYKSESTAEFEAHRHCSCEAAPVYGQWEPSDQVKEWRELWNESTKGEEDQLAAYRAAYRSKYGT